MRLDIAARNYLGIPFLHQGRNPDAGIDCVGLLVLAARDCGVDVAVHDFTGYARNPGVEELERRLQAALGSPINELMPGDIVSVDFFGKTRHVGIVGEVGGRLTLIHTYNRPAKVIEHGLDSKWLRRITGVYRIKVAA